MSRKTKRHKNTTENQDMDQNLEMSGGSTSTVMDSVTSTTKETLATVVGTVNNNKLLIGSIAAGCGAAIFLLTTDSGKRVRDGIQERAEDLYDLVSEQVTNGWGQLSTLTRDMISQSDDVVDEASEKIRRVA